MKRRRPKPRQNEKAASAVKPRVKTAARKNGKSHEPAEPEIVIPELDDPPVKKAKAPAKPRAPRKRVASDDGWIPGGG